MNIGVIAFLHESNTFSAQPTTMQSFADNLLVQGEQVREALADSHHEVGGFFEGLRKLGARATPLFAARALPSGAIRGDDFDRLMERMLGALDAAGPLDGVLAAPHGATVSERYPDADGYWLRRVRERLGPATPLIATLDPHANLSEEMVRSCDALIAYRTNPHLDQRERGVEAATLMVRTVRGEIRPRMAAVAPPMCISIDRQCTDEPHLQPLYQLARQQRESGAALSNSILLGFPYADVPEMGSAVIAVTDDDDGLAEQLAEELAQRMWSLRDALRGEFLEVDAAVDLATRGDDRVCLLDMGDNVGGGSSADGTTLLAALHARGLGPTFACLYDPASAAAAAQAGVGGCFAARIGGQTDSLHGPPLPVQLRVLSLHSGKFRETKPRHGGITDFDQGLTAVCDAGRGLTVMLTTKRMVPFSLSQLESCGLDPTGFRFLIAKGVNAPLAAYREVCQRFIRVNTPGSTVADMTRLTYARRRRPLFPFERDPAWEAPRHRPWTRFAR